MSKLLEIKDLEVSFFTHNGEVQAVRGIELEVQKGEIVCIVGESGSGKSVTAHSILQLIPMPPGRIKKGEINYNGNSLLSLDQKEMENIRGSEIGMIFQDPMTALNPTMKIGHQIIEGIIKHQKLDKISARSQALKMLELVGIPDPEKRLDQYPHEFSGGMRQRAMIAIALACEPELLIADEPTTALDVTIQAQILELIVGLKEKLNMAIVLITHDLGVVARVADRVVVMYGGQFLEHATVDEIFEHPRHPYTWGLLSSVPSESAKSKSRLNPILGYPPDLMYPPKGCPFAPRCDYAMKICKEVPPEKSVFTTTHQLSCWLEHSMAPKVNRTLILDDILIKEKSELVI